MTEFQPNNQGPLCVRVLRARCGSSARRDLRGGRRITGVPTSIAIKMKSRFEIVCRGWLSALPFVLLGPIVFWLLAAPFAMRAWSWSGLFNIYQCALPMIVISAIAHALYFLIYGLPMLVAFWKRRSIVWFLPVSLSLGFAISAVAGVPEYYREGYLSTSSLFRCLGYGGATALGCWIANKRANKT